MDQGSRRIIVGVALLALLWVGVYWAWPVGGKTGGARVTFDPGPSDAPLVVPPAAAPTLPTPVRADPVPARTPSQSPTQPPQAVGPAPVVLPPTFRDYTVRAGDSLESIAQRELGRATLWRAIAQANPLKDPRRLRPGDVLRIPVDPSNIQGRRAGDAGGDPPPAGPVEYVVRRGDTLSSIAKAYYGDAGFAELIAFHNKGRLPDPDALRTGQVLELPPLPGTTRP